MAFSKEFKEAIINLPIAEKDKLLLRLLRKDEKLANRLYFELVSDYSVEEEREAIREKLDKSIEEASDNYYSMGYLSMDVRTMSGIINRHVATTKDKIGEIDLNIYLIIGVMKSNKSRILNSRSQKANRLLVAIVARIYKILLLINKLHPDYRLEFHDQLHQLGEIVADNPKLMHTAIHSGLDVNWLLKNDIPEDIEHIYKEVKAMGFLR
ncbi:hypothetical protein MM239_09200 [Belliella sp. DSM 111904]|uniref:Uncharacterized protein n=1 Tax=Belliella filtrata TaxID=2923435 RepID=A0ABS9UZH9_9BACT|nr:hypothetical protein [Belliella filtrata]MCH7409571.1 hypothetical protein [Belliella filtrata]